MLTPLPLVSICTDVGGGTRDCGDPSPSEHQETQGIISRVRFASVTSWVLTSIPQGWLAADLDLSFCLIAMFSFFISFSDMKGDILLNEKGSVVFGSFRVADVLTRGEMVSITFADDLVFVPQFSIFLPLFVPPPYPSQLDHILPSHPFLNLLGAGRTPQLCASGRTRAPTGPLGFLSHFYAKFDQSSAYFLGQPSPVEFLPIPLELRVVTGGPPRAHRSSPAEADIPEAGKVLKVNCVCSSVALPCRFPCARHCHREPDRGVGGWRCGAGRESG